MKHSAKGAAKLARQRERQARRGQATAASSARAAVPSEVHAATAAARPASATADRSAAQPAEPTAARPASPPAARGPSRQAESRPLLVQLPYALVLAGVIGGLAIMLGGGQAVRGGTLVVAGALLAGSLARLILPDGKAGLLRSRRRLVDVGLLTALGVGLLIAGVIVQVPS